MTSELTETTVKNLSIFLRMGEKPFIGVQAEGCDPIVRRVEASSLGEILDQVAPLLAEALEKWAASPRYPAYTPPPPSPAPPRPASKPAQAKPGVERPRLF